MKTRILEVEQIIQDEELYPRYKENWFLTNKYAKAMQAGAVFPPITVALYASQFYLIDGKHRILANKKNKQKTIQAEIIRLNSKNKIFAEAVNRNVVHGAALSTQETVNCIQKLKAMNFSYEKISGIIQIPVKNIKPFVASRITNSVTGEEIALKAPLHHLAGEKTSEAVLMTQQVYSAKSQEHVLDQFIHLLETNAFNLQNERLLNKLKVVRKLIQEIVLRKRKR